MKKTAVLALKIVATLLFIAVLVKHLDGRELIGILHDVDGLYVLLGLLFSFALIAVSCWKWWFILRCQDCPVPFLKLYRWYFVGYFYSNFLPSNVGGDVARAWLVARHHQSGSLALISVFAERFTGVLVLLSLAVFMPFTRAGLWRHPAVWIVMLSALTFLFGACLLMVFGRMSMRSTWMMTGLNRLQRLLRADRPGRAARIWDTVAAKARGLADKGGHLLAVLQRRPASAWGILGLTVLFYVMAVGNVLLAYRAFGLWPDTGAVAAALPIALLVGMIPITMGNLGIAEGAYVFYFGLAGIPRELTLAMSLFLRLKVMAMGVIGLVMHLRIPAASPPGPGAGGKEIHE